MAGPMTAGGLTQPNPIILGKGVRKKQQHESSDQRWQEAGRQAVTNAGKKQADKRQAGSEEPRRTQTGTGSICLVCAMIV